MKTIIRLIILGFIVGITSSCEEEDKNNSDSGEGNILISTMLPNADGMSGSAYMQLIDNLSPASLTNETSLPVPFSSVPCVCGEDVFIIPGWGGESDMLIKYTRINGELVKQGEHMLPTQAGATNIVTKGDLAYISCALSGEIRIINHQNMELVSNLDISDYGIGDQNPNPASMLIRDNYLFVGLNQMVGGQFPAPGRPYSDVLIIDTDNYQVVKMLTDSISGISTPTRPIDPYSIFMDENNDIYIVGIGAWGALPGHNSGILRIKAGETEFDENYQFVFNSTNIEGESNKPDYVHSVRYLGNGKLYGTINIPAYYSDPVNYIEDRTVVPVEIDLAAKSIKKLDFPYSNSFGVSVGKYEDYIVFGLATTNANGYYTYNPSTGEASTSAIITTEGYPYTFNAF